MTGSTWALKTWHSEVDARWETIALPIPALLRPDIAPPWLPDPALPSTPPCPCPWPTPAHLPPLPLYVCKNDESNVFFLLLERCAVMSVLSSPAPAPAPAHPILPWPPDPALPYTPHALLNG